jgi:hypothetical protein
VAADARQHASSFNPSPDPEPRSAFLPLPAFLSNSLESYDFWERMVDVWLCIRRGTGSLAFKRDCRAYFSDCPSLSLSLSLLLASVSFVVDDTPAP